MVYCLHKINNSWGSLYHYGYCALCQYCLTAFSVKDIVQIVKDNLAGLNNYDIDYMLLNVLKEKRLID